MLQLSLKVNRQLNRLRVQGRWDARFNDLLLYLFAKTQSFKRFVVVFSSLARNPQQVVEFVIVVGKTQIYF